MTLLERLYESLLAHFGPRHWWPGETPWEVAVGAVLTQNAAWTNVEQAIARLKDAGWLDPAIIAAADPAALAEHLRPAGYFNVKARRLQAVARWWLTTDPAALDTPALRADLLAVHGVGEETADSILLYAFNRPSFVVDAYTRRIFGRHGLLDPRASYRAIQNVFMEDLPVSVPLYNDYHAQIVQLGKDYCRPTPRCATCPLRWHLDTLPPINPGE